MDAIIFIGIQAVGKSTFYQSRLFHTHVRINLDMLRTRYREKLLFQACLAAKQSFVIDNTNVTSAERAVYIAPARAAGFTTIGYFFRSRLEESLRRNRLRPKLRQVPDRAIHGTSGRMELPCVAEGFDQLFFVKIDNENQFTVEDWRS